MGASQGLTTPIRQTKTLRMVHLQGDSAILKIANHQQNGQVISKVAGDEEVLPYEFPGVGPHLRYHFWVVQ